MSSLSGFDGIEGIVLDAVGTLIDPAPSVSHAYSLAARRQGVSLDVAEIKSRFREQFATDEIDEQRGPLATDEATERRRWRRIVAGCLPEVPDQDLAFHELWDHFGDPASWIVFPDVAPALETLRQAGFRLCVASNFDGRLRRVMAGFWELRDWTERLVISSEVGFRKPHANFYTAACSRLGMFSNRVLCVGDDLRNDVLGPAEAGLRSVLIARDGCSEGDASCLDGLDSLAMKLVEGKKPRI